MRVCLLVLMVGACGTQGSDYGSGGGGGWTGPGGGELPECTDAACGTGNVCARDGECLAASQVRTVHTTWTVHGVPADPMSCASAPDLEIDFSGAGDRLGFAPVPCQQGKFTVDKLPSWYTEVELGKEGFGGYYGRIDPTTGDVMIALPY